MPAPRAFVVPTAVSSRSTSLRRARRAAVCCAARPPRPSAHALPNLTGAVASALTLLLMPFSPRPVEAAQRPSQQPTPPTKELRYDGRQELDGKEKAMSLSLTAGTFAALGIWAWKQNRRDDELENVRIKDEVERLEKLKAEFIDVDEDEESLDDEDLLASLKQRIEDSEEEEDPDAPPKEPTAQVTEEGAPADVTDDKEPDETPSESLDILKRMWEATDDDQQKKKKDEKS